MFFTGCTINKKVQPKKDWIASHVHTEDFSFLFLPCRMRWGKKIFQGKVKTEHILLILINIPGNFQHIGKRKNDEALQACRLLLYTSE